MKLIPLFAFGLSVLLPFAANADTIARLVKGPDSSAVYYSIDERRFAFPNESVYRTWYQDFSQVVTLSREELAQYRLVGNVAYPPGTLIKLTTDPKVYIVSRNNILHWIKTEEVARGLFGLDWAQQVHDFPDAFFAGYTIQTPIETVGDWQATSASQTAASISDNQNLTTPLPNTTPTSTNPTTTTTTAVIPNRLVISVTPSPLHVGDRAVVRAFAVGSTPIQQINLTVNGISTSCLSTPCTYTYPIPVYSAPTQLTIHGEGRFTDQTTQLVDGTVAITGQQQGALQLQVSSPEVARGETREITATWNDDGGTPARLGIFIDGDETKSCFNVRECRLSADEDATIGTTHRIYAKAYEPSGQEWTTVTTTITVVAQPRPNLTFSVEKETIYTGELTSIAAQASANSGITSVRLYANDQLIKECLAPTCSASAGPWSQESFVVLRAVAENRTGQQTEKAVRILVLPAPAR